MMGRWFRARTLRERWLVVFFLWSAVLLWSLLGSARLRSGWHDWQTARSSAKLLVELEQRREAARARVQAATAQPPASGDPAADLATVAGTLRVTAEPAAAPGLARWILEGQDLPAADMVEVYRRVRALGGNVQVVEATLTAAATEGRVDCRLTVRAWTP
jgi:hypothetical protein